MNKQEIYNFINNKLEEFPNNNFVKSCFNFFNTNGFLSKKQIQALKNVTHYKPKYFYKKEKFDYELELEKSYFYGGPFY